MNRLTLLYAPSGACRPALTMDAHSTERALPPSEVPQNPRTPLRRAGRDPNDLRLQRWGVIAPAGDRGNELLARIRPLIARREAEQGAPVSIYYVPQPADAGMTLADAHQWNRDYFASRHRDVEDEPLYQLILGELHEVPLAIQYAQSLRSLVGRLAFDNEDDYSAYADKLLRWEDKHAAAALGDAILHTVHDGSDAIQIAHADLLKPVEELLCKRAGSATPGRPPELRRLILSGNHGRPSAEELWNIAHTDQPSLLFTVSHGLGPPPKGGWRGPEEQRRLQGAISLGAADAITGSQIRARPFVPGGIWLMFACFGAGTPAVSSYHHWLARLSRAGYAERDDIDYVLASLPGPGERPFISAIAKAALSNPEGPLAFIGHMDLAWSYSFHDLHTYQFGRSRRFGDAVIDLVSGARVGVGLGALMGYFHEVNSELVSSYDLMARHGLRDHRYNPAYLGRLWMLRQDLQGYILLGDPAARLPLKGRAPSALAQASADASVENAGARHLDAVTEAIYRVLAKQSSYASAAHGLRAQWRGTDCLPLTELRLRQLAAIYDDAGRAAVKAALLTGCAAGLPACMTEEPVAATEEPAGAAHGNASREKR